jgi:signal peptidase II
MSLVVEKKGASPDKSMHWLWLSTLVVLLDQITKQAAEQFLLLHKAIAVIPSFNLTLMYNEGAAFSFLSNAGGWQRWFFIVLSSVISIALIIWLRQLQKSGSAQNKKFLSAGIALILGGAIGNLIDRILYGHVIDFIQVYYADFYWPAFNIADSAITLGVGLLIIDMFQEHAKEKQQGKKRENSNG